jgi:hypothetical protein
MSTAQSHQQTLQRVQNQALRIITCAVRLTPTEKMEATAGVPPVKKRWESKALIQYARAQTQTTKLSSGRRKLSSFIRKTRQLQQRQKKQYPIEVEVTPPDSGPPPHTDKLWDITINTTVPYLTTKDKHSDESKRALTLAMLNEGYPKRLG